MIRIFVIAFFLSITPAFALNHGFDPDSATTKWFESLRMPPEGVISCCSKSDSYPVDRYEKLPNGDYRVWIVDGSAMTYPDGTRRIPWDTTIPVIVPKDKVNDMKDDLDNPTDFSWLFFIPIRIYPADGSEAPPSNQVSNIYCFVRHPSGI